MEEQEKKDKKDDKEIITFIFEGIFQFGEPSLSDVAIDHMDFVRDLDNKNQEKFDLNKNEIDNYIMINEEGWELFECNVELFNKSKNRSRYELRFKFKNSLNDEIFRTTKSLMRNCYIFKYKDEIYFCYVLESLEKFFTQIEKENQFYVKISNNGNELFLRPSRFFAMDYLNFSIKINYKFIDIDLETLNFQSIYQIPKKIKGEDLNKKLGLYTNINENDYLNFEYYETKERKKILKNLSTLKGQNHNIGICGPFGTGKTVTLLKFLIETSSNRVFYINLWTIAHTSISHLKNLFKYESIKLFGGNIFNKYNFFCLFQERTIYEKIVQKIENFDDLKNIFSLLEDIIKLMNEINNHEKTYIIIDQYSSKYDDGNKLLNHLLDINKNDNIYIIISSSMNNYDIKRHLSTSLNLSSLIKDKIFDNNLRFDYYYIGCLFKLSQLDNYNDLVKNESSEFKKYLYEFGYIPLFYYELKNIIRLNEDLSDYVKDKKNKIIDEFNLFYSSDSESQSISKFLDILKILSTINEKEIYFIDELSTEILKVPLKFLEIKKEEIQLNDLKIFAFASNNQKLFDKLKDIKDNDLNRLILNDECTDDYTQFINNDNACSKYIKQISEKKRKKIIGKQSYDNILSKKIIKIYYLDYLFPYMQEIFSEMIYEILINTSKFIYKSLPSQSQGGFLEYIINTFVKKSKIFMNVLVQKFETIESIVPNNFFIQNYSSRKTDTLKTYIENNNTALDTNENFPKEDIFLNQRQFTGKYYDCGLLIYKKETNSFILYLFQVSKKKIASNRYYKEEHKIIFNRVKENLEKRYSIYIDEGYFSYILVYEERDEKTISFCEANSLNYYLFSVKDIKFTNNQLLFNDNCLITKEFPIHSSFSILPKKMFETDKKGNLINIKYIKNLENKIKFEKISEKFKGILSQFFEPKNSEISPEINEFLIAGNFDEIFEVNHCFCIWVDNDNSSLIYTNKNQKKYVMKIDDFEKLSKLKYSLLCSKYKINYIYNEK